ncbi:M14 family metallopeptidase [Haliscomenobacter sp.]|uniref:M14 family metallopeptidase n=1 Tax=Haliscomenobacter sp. TaxID=2717303 RepID=UPI00359308E7
MSKKWILILGLLYSYLGFAQDKQPLSYYLPQITYDPKIPTPEAYLGYQIGEWHISHDQQLAYMRKLAELSPRFKLTEYARTYEGRPLVYIAITSERNHQNLADLKAKHLQVSNPAESDKADLRTTPLVVYQGFSIHGNESSGGNAAPLVAYYLAAGQGPEIEKLLNDVIIIFDPCFNPDGFHRFSTWANQHRNRHLTADPQDREYSETWPGGRFNHYWFDLNRDWLSGAHPESRGRAKIFHEWKPNILTDHHEMGSNSSFFFMPGVATRVNPITPKQNQELTAKIGQYHVKYLDEIGSLYYSQEGYDDFYYGKGSTFPDVQGCIGILFEQASSRGHVQETANGLLTFAFTIRNQVRTALSTQKAAVELKQELLEHQKSFFQSAIQEARNDSRMGYVFGDPYDQARTDRLVEVLRRQEIEVYNLGSKISVEGKSFEPNQSFVVPMEQKQYRLVRGIFETTTSFEDSIFYDISSWALPLAFNVPYAALAKKGNAANVMGAKITGSKPERAPTAPPAQSSYAYMLEWEDYYAPRALQFLQSKGLRTKVGMQPITLQGKKYDAGTVMIPVQNQSASAAEIHQWVSEIVKELNVRIDAVGTGFTTDGIDLGSNNFLTLRQPKVMIVVGEGMGPNTAGEAWHLLDTRFDMVVSKVEADDIARSNLSRYNVIVMGDGTFQTISAGGVSKLKEWVSAGGTIIGIQRAVTWLKGQGIGFTAMKEFKNADAAAGRRPYGEIADDLGAQEIPGTIFEAELDLSHPLAFGLKRSKMPVFRDGEVFMEKSKNPYASPLVYTANPLMAGYLNRKYVDIVKGTAGIVVSGSGSGRVIYMADNPNFRAHWYGTNRLFLNAVFFGNLVSGAGLESERRE